MSEEKQVPEKASGDLQTAINALAALVGSNDVCELRQMRDALRSYAAEGLDTVASVAAVSALIGLLEHHPTNPKRVRVREQVKDDE